LHCNYSKCADIAMQFSSPLNALAMSYHHCFHIPQVATFSVSSSQPLPTFAGDLARPDYVDKTVTAIIADGNLSSGEFLYIILAKWIGGVKGEKLQAWAEAYAREIEQEAHELSNLECDFVGA